MNLGFFIGKIVSDIQFDFILNSKNISIARFKLELENKSIIKIKACNELADYCYKKLEKEDVIGIVGMINLNMEIIIIDVEEI